MKLPKEAVNEGWYLIPSDTVMKCEECDYVGKEWAENDKFQDVETKTVDDEICNTVFCPNCSSWSYFDVEETEMEQVIIPIRHDTKAFGRHS